MYQTTWEFPNVSPVKCWIILFWVRPRVFVKANERSEGKWDEKWNTVHKGFETWPWGGWVVFPWDSCDENSFLAKLWYFTNLDFPEIKGCPFLNYILGAQVVWGRYNLTRYMDFGSLYNHLSTLICLRWVEKKHPIVFLKLWFTGDVLYW